MARSADRGRRGSGAVLSLDDQLAELWAAGASFTDMGLKLGETRSVIAGRIDRARKSAFSASTSGAKSQTAAESPRCQADRRHTAVAAAVRAPPPTAAIGRLRLARLQVAGRREERQALVLRSAPAPGRPYCERHASAQTHSKDSGTTIPWHAHHRNRRGFIVGFTKGGEISAAPSV
jgi:hypothetical protein